MLEDTYSGPVRTLANPTLLIVDDEPHIRMLLEEALEELEDEGVRILMAEDGAQGLETISREKPDLVFLDVMMPKMNGFDVCTAVKKQLALDNVFIVMLTAKGQEFDKVKGRESGTDIYMTKPFSPMDVLSLARKILGLN
nr:response regulator [Oceanidesulfovibrio marinus]